MRYLEKMPVRVYEKYKKIVRNWAGTKDGLQNMYDTEIKYQYSDWKEALRMIDKQQVRWRMDLD